MDSEKYSWAWVTADRQLSTGPCELCAVVLTADGANCETILYDGIGTNGDIIAKVKALQNRSCAFNIHHHIYCRKGLYIDVDANTKGIFVQWIERQNGVPLDINHVD